MAIIMKSRKKIISLIFIPLITFLVLTLIFVCVVAVLKKKTQDIPSEVHKVQMSTENSFGKQQYVISYEGKDYYYNNHIKTYLFMGIDKEDPVEIQAGKNYAGGRSDTMFLLVTNEEDKTLSMISINRNSMADVEVYSTDGTDMGIYNLQICLQHAYGDGGEVSCQRSVEAVSRLFYDLPISGYIAMNMGAIPGVNDAVGGVELEVLQTMKDKEKKVNLQEGELVTLTGEEAYFYIRNRDDEVFDSATERLRRQEQYMGAFARKLREVTAQDPTCAARLYTAMEEYTVTDMDAEEMITSLLGYSFNEQQIYTVPGETVMGEELEEYHVDDGALYELILSIFYKEGRTEG